MYASGNIDFPREQNGWAFDRMQGMRSDQEKRVVVHPEIAPLEFARAAGVEKEKTGWLEPLQEMLNASSAVNLLRRPEALRLRKAVFELDKHSRIVTLVSQEAFEEFSQEHWNRIAFFYAYRHDGFRFDISTMISMKDRESAREKNMELTTRVVDGVHGKLPCVTFDATGAAAHVNIVEWRASVAEGQTGRFKLDDTRIHIVMPKMRAPLTFLYERREEFGNHSYQFSGERIESELKRLIKKRRGSAGKEKGPA